MVSSISALSPWPSHRPMAVMTMGRSGALREVLCADPGMSAEQ